MSPRREFLEVARTASPYRAVEERVRDHRELIVPLPLADVEQQAARCMECGVPFCHNACPLGNLIPEWNEPARRGDWEAAFAKLDSTNNFPEFTGWLCPAPCEPACVLAIGGDAVSIKEIERTAIEQAFSRGWVRPRPPAYRSGLSVAVVGSGPAGLAAAQQLNRGGHSVTVYDKADRPGGLLRYGIPDFKMAKSLLDRRLDLLTAEGIGFECGYDCGVDITGEELLTRHDAVVLAVGAEKARDVLDLPGRDLGGIHLAMDYLVGQNRRVAGRDDEVISAAGRNVVIIGGGDTASDCLGDSHRESCASVRQLVIYPQPPSERPGDNPWPEWPLVLRSSAAHLEGGDRVFGAEVTGFHGTDGMVDGISVVDVTRVERSGGARRLVRLEGSERRIDADLVLLAIGFGGVRTSPLFEQLGAQLDAAGRISGGGAGNVVACGDAVLGASLVVNAIADGRRAATECQRLLRSRTAATA